MLEEILVSPETTLHSAMGKIDSLGTQGLVVVDSHMRLLGTLTDGDIRRTLLSGGKMTDKVIDHCNKDPIYSNQMTDFQERKLLMSRLVLNILPIVDSENRVMDVQLHRENEYETQTQSPVLIMAGGRGARLGSLTESTPKPLLKIGDRPILEILLTRLALQGIKKVFISIHYLGEEIRSLYGDGRQLGLEIIYIDEQVPLGTAGSLGFLQSYSFEFPIIVTNADVIHNLDFQSLLNFHIQNNFEFTVTTAKYITTVPFGVVVTTNNRVISISEKPVREENINAGIYVIEPKLLNLIEKNQRLEMTDLIEILLANNCRIGAFALNGYWKDVGDPVSLKNVSKGN